MRPAATLGLGILFGLVSAAAVDADGRVAALDGPPGTTPVIEPAVAIADPSPLTTLAAGDAMSDRAFGRSTAIGLEPGQFDFSLRTAVEHGSLLSIAAGISSGIELSVDAGYARRVADDVGVGVKFTLMRRASYALAIDVSVHSTSEQDSRTELVLADLKFTTCALDCNMLFTAGIGLVTPVALDNSSGQTTPSLELSMLFGKSVVRPLIEALRLTGDTGTSYAFGGLRIGGKHLAVDLGVGVIDEPFTDAAFGMLVGVGVRP